ncbi:MAG: glycosyltransferase [Acidimicrobiales bacterium]|nr:glycosyltransferase [Actinomycetota bacterium]
MKRFLFVAPPLVGHINPTVAVGLELKSRGHVVAWSGYKSVLTSVLPSACDVVWEGEDLEHALISRAQEESVGLRGAAALEFLWTHFLIPLARAMLPGVDSAVATFAPDVMVVDQQALAGALVARSRRILWATSATTPAELVDPFALLPKVGDWVQRQLADLTADSTTNGSDLDESVDDQSDLDLRFSEHLILAFTTSQLTGPLTLPSGAGPVAMVGPSLVNADAGKRRDADRRYMDDGFPNEFLDYEDGRILITLGTVNALNGSRFFSAAIDALRGTPWRAILVAPRGVVGDVPSNVMVMEHVPQMAVLENVDAVVCHGGHNTVCEAVSKGLPLVVAPIRDDQPIVAEQVVRAGAGIRVKFGRVSAGGLRTAIEAVMTDPSYRDAVKALQSSFDQAGGAHAAADHLERLAS